ncbi:MAG: hypothetical protein ACI915_001679 [Gammaproteobacteria bacterium]
MELQSKIDAFTAAGAAVYSLSYDEPDALADFRDAYGITFTMLSDPDSEIIRELGVLNTLIKEDDHPWFGVPFPGTYLIDEHGLVGQKFFGNNFALRIGPEMLLRALQPDATANRQSDIELPIETTWNVSLDGERLIVSVLRDLVARIEVPAPGDKLAVDLLLKKHPRVVVGDMSVSESKPVKLKGSGELIQAHDGVIELRVPLAVNANLAGSEIASQEDVTLSGELRWQTVDSEGSSTPRHEKFELTAAVGAALRSELTAPVDGVVIRAMNGMKHFQRLAARRGVTDLTTIMPK